MDWPDTWDVYSQEDVIRTIDALEHIWDALFDAIAQRDEGANPVPNLASFILSVSTTIPVSKVPTKRGPYVDLPVRLRKIGENPNALLSHVGQQICRLIDEMSTSTLFPSGPVVAKWVDFKHEYDEQRQLISDLAYDEEIEQLLAIVETLWKHIYTLLGNYLDNPTQDWIALLRKTGRTASNEMNPIIEDGVERVAYFPKKHQRILGRFYERLAVFLDNITSPDTRENTINTVDRVRDMLQKLVLDEFNEIVETGSTIVQKKTEKLQKSIKQGFQRAA